MVEYKKNVAIIGAGIFGLTVARELSKSNHFNITVFEAEKDIMMGASSNNLNRVHKGFHYPRSIKTAYQSKNNYQKFMRYFKNCTRKNIKSYYLISKNNTKTSLKNFIKFSKKISNNSKVINIKNLPFKTHNIKGAIKTNEGVYDWTKIKLFFIKKLKKKIKIILDTKLIKILIKKNLINLVDINSKIYGGYNYVIDCSYFFNNNFLRYKKKLKKKKYQKTLILEVSTENFPTDTGVAIMDGKFISFLPKGFSNKVLIYDVKNSVIIEKKSKLYPKEFRKKIPISIIKNKSKSIIKNFKIFFPNLMIKKILNYKISNRVIEINTNDSRISKIGRYKNIFFLNQGKTDHCIEIAQKIKNKLLYACRNNY